MCCGIHFSRERELQIVGGQLHVAADAILTAPGGARHPGRSRRLGRLVTSGCLHTSSQPAQLISLDGLPVDTAGTGPWDRPRIRTPRRLWQQRKAQAPCPGSRLRSVAAEGAHDAMRFKGWPRRWRGTAQTTSTALDSEPKAARGDA